ncbi:MAG: 2Fe-2S iron-sulfur cluster binding domain-containing protein [Lentisphaerae bacterium]|nr:2Fe-2S iron-sulfur cluster binding domain-containing protein [Lentisphaerota bacterium]
MVTIKVNGRELQADENQTILEAARAAGIRIPTLCYHKELTPYGACRVCLVEIVAGGRPGLQAACLYKCAPGLEVSTDTQRVERARRVVLELLLARSPESEKVRALAAEYGVTGTRFNLAPENCILCGLCVRACAEISRRNAIGFSGRGPRRTVGTPFRRLAATCIGCGACVYVCPTNTIEIEERD